jgi:hypothetical protein
MPTLRKLQAAFAGHLAGGDPGDLVLAVEGGRIPAAARLAVYRHHVRHSLSTALAATFPTVCALVGADFFARLAGDFIARSLPMQPVLAEYGEGFPSFVSTYGPASGLPYLRDVARLDWSLNAAMHADPVHRLAVEDLSAIAPDRLPSHVIGLPPRACVIDSPYPIDRIWQASQPDADRATVDLGEGGCRLLVLPGEPTSFFVGVSAAEAAFLGALPEKCPLEEAAGRAFAVDADFDLGTSFARLLNLGAFVAAQ